MPLGMLYLRLVKNIMCMLVVKFVERIEGGP